MTEGQGWQKAKEGELWALTRKGQERAYLARGRGMFQSLPPHFEFVKTDPEITASRRLWPAEEIPGHREIVAQIIAGIYAPSEEDYEAADIIIDFLRGTQ